MENEVEKVIAQTDLKISPGTIARTVILAVGLLNQILVRFGHPIINLDSALVTELVADIWVIVASIAAWWKNNSFTLPALAGDVIMKSLRKGKTEGKSND